MSIFRRFLEAFSGQGAPEGPKGHRAYAIGDIHGRLDLLDQLLIKVEADIAGRRPCKNVIVFLGDLIDRGPQSAQVVERLRTWQPRDGSAIFLSGNHEEVFLRVLAGEGAVLADWLQFGGEQCLESYGVDVVRLRQEHFNVALAAIHAAVPSQHRVFLESFADTLRFGDYLFVHAGIRPGIEIERQDKKDLRWIRDPFLDDERDHGCVVVHGHTISKTVDERPNRVGLDTGAYKTGVLTAMAVEGRQRWFLETA